jgi:inactivated superfamily I helicase
MRTDTEQPDYGLQEDAHIRELLRACTNFLEAVEADPALASRTRMAAAGVAAAVQRTGSDWQALAREWRLLRLHTQEAQQHLQGIERKLVDLYGLMEQEEWPSIS